ncbi:MAG: hypothetical protein JWP85_1641 [Rhodoglobus sp.]|nr:hypothetical protein [Rhodoglobus sp.]
MTTTDQSPARPDDRGQPVVASTPGIVRRWHSLTLRSQSRLVLVLVLVLVALVWEIASRTGLLNAQFVSRPTAIVASIPELLASETVRAAVIATVAGVLVAAVYGTVIGIVLGYVMGFFAIIRAAFFGPALFLLSVPKSIFIPIFLVFFGLNRETAIFYGAFSGFIYVIVNVVAGFDLIREQDLRIAKAFGAKIHHRILDIVFPATLPGVFAGIWYGVKGGLQGILIFEFFVSVGGLGALITQYSNELRTDRVFALTLGMAIFAIALGAIWTAIERRLAKWRPQN